ncbi:M12 family metallo-peptidase [Flavobacterium sp.]
MKKLPLLSLLVSLCTSSYTQNGKVAAEITLLKENQVHFEKCTVLHGREDAFDVAVDTVVEKATYAELNLNEVERIYNSGFQAIEFSIPYQNQSLKIELYRVNPFAHDFKVKTDKSDNLPYAQGVYYRGIIKGNERSVASFNFFNNEMNGIVSSVELGNLNIVRLQKPLNVDEYVIYSDVDLLIKNDFECATKDVGGGNYNTGLTTAKLLTNKCVTSYFEIGYQAFTANGSNLVTTANWITSVFNNAQTLFDNDGISIVLKTVFIWTTNDHYSTSSNFILPAFANIRPSFDGDIGFIADIDPQQLTSQSFAIGGLCSDRKYAYGDLVLAFAAVPVYSYPVYIIAHELGHSLGSHHTHACVWNGNNTAIDGCAQSYGGCPTPTPPADGIATIMSYCFPNFAIGFGEQPANAMIEHINNSGCLGSDCVDSCINTIGLIQTYDVTQDTANISWTDSNTANSQWDISVVPAGDNPFWINVSSTSYTVGSLLPNTHYEVSVRGVCPDGLTFPRHSILFATQGANCEGTVIYDTGGDAGGYRGGEHIIRTIVPTQPNKKIRLHFTRLSIIPFQGFLFIYDGMNNNGPLLNYLTFGYPFKTVGYSSSFEPAGPAFRSDDPSGALTLEFFSSQEQSFYPIAATRGWRAVVSCLDLLGNDETDGFLDYSYSPNPVKNVLNVKSKDSVDAIAFHSMEGKLLINKTPLSNDFNIDLSELPNGIYMASLSISGNKTSFKIVKE